jgi:ferredoxin
MSRPMWLVEIVKHFFPDRFVIAGWTKKIPLARKVVDYLMFEQDDIIYLPKDRVVINQAIDKQENMVLPSKIIEHFIEKANYVWLMNKCICRDSTQCEDYPIDLGCIFLGEPVLGINPKLGRLATKEEAYAQLRRAREAGLVHLIGRNKLDTLWMGLKPGEKLMTICNCCPCCCLYKVLPDLDASISSKIAKMPGVKVTVTEKCIGCGTCVSSCFVGAIQIIDGVAVHNDDCRGCGRCVEICPQEAVELTIEDEFFFENAVKRLSAKVDVT